MEDQITIICASCGKPHLIRKSNRRTKTCSTACSNTYRARNTPRPDCAQCGKPLPKVTPSKMKMNRYCYCSKECEGLHRRVRFKKRCLHCGGEYECQGARQHKSKYCSRGCASEHLSMNRKIQYRSFGECAILLLLRKNFPDVELVANDRATLWPYEIDIWIPSIKTGIEYNGIHHFEPVYGEALFEKTKLRDAKKRTLALEKGVRIIDVNARCTISRTTKAKIMDLFRGVCVELGWTPTNFELDWDNVDAEKRSRKAKPILDKKEPKIHRLLKPDGTIVTTGNLWRWCKENCVSHTGLYHDRKRGQSRRDYRLLPVS